ncbi:hypothetical protein CP556_02040 [Natrinema sp. CBA1119]|uniref:DUF7344 domain-containing protein n=1 Tax=Natrinema sp. CBA1119 TaxID=1608465 RepID=UPI000BF2C4F6|nr:hypothetical protein [Natrinema sp. CBA1119]PGF15025.1 hypothetical protein CP556_02040 [Natrinema sp. CBA1119]
MGNDEFEPDPFALDTAAGELPVDDVFRLLADRHARYALIYLHDNPTPTVEELADVLAAKDASDRATIATPADRNPIRIRLYHAILPRIDALGFIAFDSGTNAVTDAAIPTAVTDAMGVTDPPP